MNAPGPLSSPADEGADLPGAAASPRSKPPARKAAARPTGTRPPGPAAKPAAASSAAAKPARKPAAVKPPAGKPPAKRRPAEPAATKPTGPAVPSARANRPPAPSAAPVPAPDPHPTALADDQVWPVDPAVPAVGDTDVDSRLTLRRRRTGDEPSSPDRSRRRRLVGTGAWVLLGLVLLVAAAYVGLAVKAGDTVPAGASVAGVDIGGMHTRAAERRLDQVLGARAAQPIRVSAAGLNASFRPATAGLTLDVPDSVRSAGGGSSYSPARLWRYYTGGHDHDAVTHQQAARFRAAAERVVALVAKPDVEGRITFRRGRAISHAAEDGRRVSLDQAGTSLTHGFLRGSVSEVSYDVLRPDVGNAAVRSAMSDFARPATSGPVTLELGKQKVVVAPDRYTGSLRMVPDNGSLKPEVDVSRLMAALEPALTRLDGTPRPAQITIDDGRPTVVASRPGTTFDRSDLRGDFLDVLTRTKDRSTSVDTVRGPPTFTTADARAMKVTSLVSETTTPFGYADYRNTNIARAADLLDGTIVQPGHTFSLARAIGRPDRSNGFVPGVEIVGGVFKADAGAGLSQVASTLFNTMFDAGLRDAGHEVTSVYTKRYPLGREASFEYGTDDLRFTNDTKYGVLIKAAASPSSQSGDGSLRIEMWSTKVWDVTVTTSKRYDRRPALVTHRTGATCSATIGYPGFSVDVTRVFRRPGQQAVDHRRTTTTVYRPADSIVCDP